MSSSQCSGFGQDHGEQNKCTTSLKCYLAVLGRLTQHEHIHALYIMYAYGVHLCDFILYHRLMRSHEIVITPCNIYVYFSLQRGQTALMVASRGGHVECVKLLLEKGASVDLMDEVSAGSHQLLSV